VSAAHPAAAVDAAASPISPAPADRMASFLPTETKIQVTLQEIVLGGGRTIAPFALTARLHGEQPVSGDLSFDSSNHGVRASLLPGAGRASWSLKVDDVADLIAVGTSPLRELPAAMTSADTTIGGLISLPEWFEGGRLTSDGTLDLENAGNVMQGHLQIRDLLLRREIPFLSSIAALVKHSVKKGTPFDEFRVDSFTIGRKSAHLQNAFLDGPISLTAEKADFDFVTSELFLRGKIFGIWFEVKGPRGKPEFYLADKNAALKYLTTEDEFQW